VLSLTPGFRASARCKGLLETVETWKMRESGVCMFENA